jgi:hypothetical protein
LAGEDGIGRLRVVLKGEEAGESEGSTTPGIGESFRLKSFPKNFFAPVGVFCGVVTADGTTSRAFGVGSPVELREIAEDSGVCGTGLRW